MEDLPVGIKNVGFTCYMNSCIQVLYHTPHLTKIFNFLKHEINNKGSSFMISYLNVIQGLDPTTGTKSLKLDILSVFMKQFITQYPYFESIQKQHDAHETLLCIIDKLHDDYKEVQTINHVSKIFDINIDETIHCKKCTHKATNHQCIRNINLYNFDNDIQSSINCLFKCSEYLDEYKCDHCSEKNTTLKVTTLKNTGQVLIVNLNLYDVYGKKLNTQVNVNDSVKVNNSLYTLYATINHFGQSNNGHYLCFVKQNEKWFGIDDNRIAEVHNADICKKHAYTLLYKLQK